MNQEVREQIALFRYMLISPILAEPKRAQNAYFKTLSEKHHDIPHYGTRRIRISTFKSWLRKYRQKGLKALEPKHREDAGRPRRLGKEALEAVFIKVKAFPDWPISKLHEHLIQEKLIGQPPLTYNSLLRLLKKEKLFPKPKRNDSRKRFEVSEVNELWTCDFMHGPHVTVDHKKKKAILCAIIDDHSRMIVGFEFSPHETMNALVTVLKDAFLTYGIPKRFYVDNGSAFSCDLLTKACAQSQISLIHSKPYDSPSRGKIERFFRTVREQFLTGLAKDISLRDLNEIFLAWLRDQYHIRVHSGIGQTPLERYQLSAKRTHIKRLSQAELDNIFLVRHERVVNNDATISFERKIYEVPSAYIRQRIEIRHPVDDIDDIALYDKGVRVARLKIVDVKENARVFRPSTSYAPISYSDKMVKS